MKQNSMLSQLLSKFAMPEAGVVVPPVEAVVVEGVAELQSQFDAFKAEASNQISELSAALETAVQAVADADAKVAELSASKEALQALVDAAQADKATLVAQAEEKRLQARKEAVQAAVGTAKADALMAATSTLDDAAFEAVVSALTASVDAEAKSPLFSEVGATAEVDASQIAEVESLEMKQLREKYAPK